MRMLITGATGLIGHELASTAVNLGHDLYSAQHETKPDFGKAISLNIKDSISIEKCFESVKPDSVIHLAAFTDVDQCEIERELALEMNAKAVERVARETRRHGSHLIHVSTDYVFDGEKGMYDENDEPRPVNWYGESKLRGEEAAKVHASSWCIARTSTPFGLHPSKKCFPVFVAEKLKNGVEMKVIEDQYTSPTYLCNLSRMLIEIAEQRLQGIIHVSGATRISRLDLAKAMAKSLVLNQKLIKPVKMQDMNWSARRPKDTSLDVTKANITLKNKPEPIEQSLAQFVTELRDLSRHKL